MRLSGVRISEAGELVRRCRVGSAVSSHSQLSAELRWVFYNESLRALLGAEL